MGPKLTQTELGNVFGFSSIEMGKKLIKLRLRDKDTKLATDYAINNSLAKNVTFSRSGKNITISKWDLEVIEYINKKTRQDNKLLIEVLIGKFKMLKKIEDDDTQSDKLQQWSFDFVYKDFEILIKENQNNHKILTLFYLQLEKFKLVPYAKKYSLLDGLEEIAMKTTLEKKLKVNKINKKPIKI